ncbi:MAG: ATPase [Clostridiaceae bacterium]|nr:ATPase [Clostridiaceae bacterium]
MNVMNLLEYLQEIVDSASKIPMTGKIVLDKKEVEDTIDQIINFLPDEFKKAQWVYTEKERILSDAMSQAESIKKENIDLIKRQIDNHSIIKEATIKAEEILAIATRDAKAMRLGARDYADEVLCQLENEVDENGKKMVTQITMEMENFFNHLQANVSGTTNTIRENVKELRNIK